MSGSIALPLGVAVLAAIVWLMGLHRTTIQPGEVGLLYRRGKFVREITGFHRWFGLLGATDVVRVSLLPQTLTTAALEVMSRDQFAFRLTVAVLGTVTDARAMHEGTPRPADTANKQLAMMFAMPAARFDRLHPVLSAAVLEAIAGRTLDEFLAAPKEALSPVAHAIGSALPGTHVEEVLVTTVTLPPELRKMFTEVERARREGLAQLERARGEQAALRALANAARNLADNPQLGQLRMLQTMENAKGAKTFVLGKLPDGPTAG